MIFWNFFVFLSLFLFVFQNCGSFESVDTPNLYSYTEKPDFFHDAKLVRAQNDNLGRREYLVDFAVSYSQDPKQDVVYQLQFSTLKISNVCNTVEEKASGENKHFRARCLIPVPESLFVQLTLLGPEEEGKQMTHIYRFD